MDSYCRHHCLYIWLGDPRHTENGWLLPTRGKEHPSTKQKLWSVNCSLGKGEFYREQEGQRSALCILCHQSTSGPHAVERSWCVHSRNSPANTRVYWSALNYPLKGLEPRQRLGGNVQPRDLVHVNIPLHRQRLTRQVTCGRIKRYRTTLWTSETRLITWLKSQN